MEDIRRKSYHGYFTEDSHHGYFIGGSRIMVTSYLGEGSCIMDMLYRPSDCALSRAKAYDKGEVIR